MPLPASLVPVQQWATAQGLDLEGSILECHFVTQFKEETVGTLSGLPCDDYARALRRVVIQSAVASVALDGAGDDLSNKAWASLVQELHATDQIPYAGPTRIDRGSPAPDLSGIHNVPWQKLCILAQAEEDILDSLISGNDALFEQAIYARFSQSDVFQRQPCDSALFLTLYQNRKEFHHETSCSISDYYAWYLRSAESFTAAGEIQSTVHSEVQNMLKAWKDMEPKQQRYWLCRNLQIHPMHVPAFDALLASHHGETTVPADRPTRPRRFPG